jgi:hypothetical protein
VTGGSAWGNLGQLGQILGEGSMELIFEFQMNLEFGKTLRNFTRRFRRNLDMRIFPKFSRILRK